MGTVTPSYDSTIAWAVVCFLALSFLAIPGLYLLQRFMEWNQLRRWRNEYRATVLPMRKR